MAQQTIGIGTSANDGTGDTIRDAFDKCNDNFTELYTGLTGLLDFKGSTDCSANPNYPAASKGDFYLVSVAGKIGGASGISVEVGDSYFATADNAGGTQAGVGSSWTVIQGNITSYLPLSGGTLTGDLVVPAEAYGAGWNGSNEVPTKNDVYDKIEAVAGGSGSTTLAGLTDVDTTGVADGDVLTYDSGSSEWIPAAPSGGGGGGAGPSIRGSGIQSSSNTSYTVSWPSGTVAGDRALIFCAHAYPANAPAGWTTLDNSQGSNTNGAVFTRILSSADITAGSVAVTFAGSYNGVVAIVTLQGSGTIRTTNPFRSSSGVSSFTLNTDGSPLTTDQMILFAANRGNSTNTISLGSALQTVSASEASGVLKNLNPASNGGISPVVSFSTAGSGYYAAAVAISG